MRNFRQRYRQPNGPLAARRGSGGYDPFVVMPTYIRTADKASLDITGDLTLYARVSVNWSTSSNMAIIAKRTVSNWSWQFMVHSPGLISLGVTADGSTSTSVVSTSTGLSGTSIAWVGVDRRQSDGRVRFFTAPDQKNEPSSWTQVGTDQTGTTSAYFSGSADVELGSNRAFTNNFMTGRLYRVIIKSGSSTVADFNAATLGLSSSYADAYGNTWTVG